MGGKENEYPSKDLTLKDILENPVYLEMMKYADDWAGHLTRGWKKFGPC